MLRNAVHWLVLSALLAPLPSCSSPDDSTTDVKDVTPEGLTSGQLLWLTETRSAEMTNPPVVMANWPYFDVASTGAPGSIAWGLSTCDDIVRGCNVAPIDPVFTGNVADVAGRAGIPAGPVWETGHGSKKFNVNGKTVLFPADNLPTGKWTFSVQLEYEVAPYFKDQPFGPDIGPIIAYVSIDVTCRYLNAAGKKRSRTLASDSKSYRYSNPNFTADHIGFLSPVLDLGAACASLGTQAELGLSVNVSNVQKFQFNGIHFSMSSVN